jgi:hypothetical protein
MLLKSYILNFIIDEKFNVLGLGGVVFDWEGWCLTGRGGV